MFPDCFCIRQLDLTMISSSSCRSQIPPNTTGGHRHRPGIFVTCRGGSGHANVDSYGSLVKGVMPEVTWDISAFGRICLYMGFVIVRIPDQFTTYVYCLNMSRIRRIV